jgi:hypothetical protein
VIVALATETPDAGTPPIDTVAPAMKLAPVRVTTAPPPVPPLFGITEVNVGTTGCGLSGLVPPPPPSLPHPISNTSAATASE